MLIDVSSRPNVAGIFHVGGPTTVLCMSENTPAAAAEVFGDRLALAEAYHQSLATTAAERGFIGPKEVDRLWERHILNCAVIEDAFPRDARIIDVGSGAGLPGVALAIARPDLDLHLVEPMHRRTEWLTEAATEIGLDNVTVHRGRAEEFHGSMSAPFVTARAVARLDKLARWCFPLTEDGGQLVALKGRSAEEELAATTKALRKAGLVSAVVSSHGEAVLEVPTLTVDCVVRQRR